MVAHLKFRTPSLDQHAKRVSQLCGLDVGSPAIRIVSEQMQSLRNVCRHDFRIDYERRSEHVFYARHAVTLVPGKLAQHEFMGRHCGFDHIAQS